MKELLQNNIKSLINSGLSFAIWRTPGDEAKIIVSSAATAFQADQLKDIIHQHGYLIAPFDVLQHPFLLIEGEAQILDKWEGAALNNLLLQASSCGSDPYEIRQQEYLKQANHFVTTIKEGQLVKAILSRVVGLSVGNDDLSSIFDKLCERYLSAYIFWFYTPQSGMWMGATPELFLECTDNQYTTIALAGTRNSRGDTSSEWQRKELHEQELVSQYIRDVLERHQATNILQSGPQTIEAGQMKHLRTSFQFELNQQDTIDGLMLDLHPTPAVCGLPKTAAMQLIHETERHDRAYYGGFNGYINPAKKQLYVSLRCMQLIDSMAYLYVGGGITNASESQAEWDETVLKSQTLLSVLKNI